MRYRYLVDLRRGISVFAIFRKVLRYWVPPMSPSLKCDFAAGVVFLVQILLIFGGRYSRSF